MYPKKDSYSTRESKNRRVENISFPTSKYINLSFLKCRTLHNCGIFLAKVLSLILDGLDKT